MRLAPEPRPIDTIMKIVVSVLPVLAIIIAECVDVFHDHQRVYENRFGGSEDQGGCRRRKRSGWGRLRLLAEDW